MKINLAISFYLVQLRDSLKSNIIMKKTTFKDYLEAAFFAYMHENSICPLTHEGIEFYFGKIYERRIDRKEWSTYFDVRDDLNFIVNEAREMQANGLKLGWNKGIPFVDPYQD